MIILITLVHYSETNNILFKNQYGLRQIKDTGQVIASFTKLVFSVLEKENTNTLILINNSLSRSG